MRTSKLLAYLFFLTAPVSLLTAETPRCSASAPCFTIANRLGSAALAVKSLSVSHVYLNGRLLTEGAGADYQMQTGASGKSMVIVHMPPNTTGKPEVFQAIVK
jgi:hypothetical protein